MLTACRPCLWQDHCVPCRLYNGGILLWPPWDWTTWAVQEMTCIARALWLMTHPPPPGAVPSPRTRNTCGCGWVQCARARRGRHSGGGGSLSSYAPRRVLGRSPYFFFAGTPDLALPVPTAERPSTSWAEQTTRHERTGTAGACTLRWGLESGGWHKNMWPSSSVGGATALPGYPYTTGRLHVMCAAQAVGGRSDAGSRSCLKRALTGLPAAADRHFFAGISLLPPATEKTPKTTGPAWLAIRTERPAGIISALPKGLLAGRNGETLVAPEKATHNWHFFIYKLTLQIKAVDAEGKTKIRARRTLLNNTTPGCLHMHARHVVTPIDAGSMIGRRPPVACRKFLCPFPTSDRYRSTFVYI
jgi:hypothetical protein